MPNPKEQLVEAFADQGKAEWQYAGVDAWKNGTIKAGTRIAQIEYRDAADAAKPNSRYFTDVSEIEKVTGPNGKVDMTALSERLQVKAHGGQYNASVSIYEATEDIAVTTSKITDNPALGAGGANQYFVPQDVKELGKSLEKLDQLTGVNRTPRLPVFDDLSRVNDSGEIKDVIERYNLEYIDALEESGNPKALEVANDMKERQAFSETARDIKGDPEAIKAVEFPDTATTLDLDAKTLSQVERIRDESLGRSPDRGADGPDRGNTHESGPDRAPDTPAKPPAALDEAGRADAATRLSSADELGELRSFAATPDGSVSHIIDTKNSTIYTLNGDDVSGVQKFDSSKEAGHAFGKMMGKAAQAHPNTFKGLPEVHNSLGSLGNHIDDLGRPAWRKALGAAGDTAAEFGGKATKILGPLGVAAAGAEVYGLEMKLQDYEKFGLVPEEAITAYRANLVAHTAQATVDPSLVGGEAVVQGAHELWANQYGIDDKVKEALAPGSLVKDVFGAKQWLDAQALKAQMEVADYVKEVWNDPNKIVRDVEAVGDAVIDTAVNTAQAIGNAAVDTAEAVGGYASSRFEEPEKLLDDAAVAGSAIYHAPGRAWNALFGPDEPSALERSLEAAGSTPPFVPYGQAVSQFSDDREILRASDPQAALPVTQAANHPEAEATFVRLHEAGIERFPAEALEGDTAQERVGNILVQAQEIDQDLQAERALEQQAALNQHVQPHYQAEEENEYGY